MIWEEEEEMINIYERTRVGDQVSSSLRYLDMSQVVSSTVCFCVLRSNLEV